MAGAPPARQAGDCPVHNPEGRAGRRPVLECAALEIEGQRLAVPLRRHTFRTLARGVGHIQAPFHACCAVTGNGAVVGVAPVGTERQARAGTLLENLGALDLMLFECDVMDHQLAVDDGDAHGFPGQSPDRRVPDTVDFSSDSAVPQYRRFQRVLAVHASGSPPLAREMPARAGEEEERQRETNVEGGHMEGRSGELKRGKGKGKRENL